METRTLSMFLFRVPIIVPTLSGRAYLMSKVMWLLSGLAASPLGSTRKMSTSAGMAAARTPTTSP